MRLGILGHQISYTLSPSIHKNWMELHGLSGDYQVFDTAQGAEIPQIIQELKEGGLSGINVTVPHKESILSFCDEKDPLVVACGAANTLSVIDGRIVAHNTDVLGLREIFQGLSLERGALVLGAGGAAKAVIHALTMAGTKDIYVSSRREMPLGHQTWIPWDKRHGILPQVDLVINATPLGQGGEGNPLDHLGGLCATAHIMDLIYTPRQTPLLKMARDTGHPIIEGMDLLVRQARHSFHIWTGIMPELEDLPSAVKK